jgi:hypothetical protein
MKDYLNIGNSVRETKGKTSLGLASSPNPFALQLLLSTPNGQKIFLQAISCIAGISRKGR